ncbi:MAG: hypothetical protein ACE361_17600 [Aureliella sp.]
MRETTSAPNHTRISQRTAHRRLLKLARSEIADSATLAAEHHKRRWQRRLNRAARWIVLGFVCAGVLIGILMMVMIGFMLHGPASIGKLIGAGLPPSIDPVPVIAGWCIFCWVGLLSAIYQIRNTTIALKYQPYAAHLPLDDRTLISPWSNALGGLSVALLSVACGALIPVAVWGDITWPQAVGLSAMVLLSVLFVWLLAEWIASYVPVTPLVASILITTSILLFLFGVVVGAVPRTVIEIRQAQSFGPIWILPPAGWLVGISGLLDVPELNLYGLPFFAVITMALLYRHVRTTMQLEDIRITNGQRQPALRHGWVRAWKKPQPRSEFEPIQDDDVKTAELLSTLMRRELGQQKRSRIATLLMPWRLGARERAILGLSGIHHPRRSHLSEFKWGLWPIVFAIALLISNQYFSLFAFPRFLRIPLLIGFALSLIDFRIFQAISEASQSGGVFSPRVQQPFSGGELLLALLKNRLLFLWNAIPGWFIAVGVLLFTDIPVNMVVQPPLIIGLASLLIAVYLYVSIVTSNLRSCWQVWWLVVLPWSLFSIAAILLIQFGVLGSVLAMRPDLAWWFLLGSAALLLVGASIVSTVIAKLRLDESTITLANAIRYK